MRYLPLVWPAVCRNKVRSGLTLLVASILFQGVELTSIVGDTEMDFAMRFDASSVSAGILFSCCAGLLGAMIFAVRAVRSPVAEALRTL